MHASIIRMLESFNTRGDTVEGFSKELLAAVSEGGYEPGDIERATTIIVRSEEFFPKVATFLKVLDSQRQRQAHRRAMGTPKLEDAVLDHTTLVGWVCGHTLTAEMWRRVAPARMIPGEWASWPGHSEMDKLIPGWLPTADPKAIVRTLEDVELARDPRQKGERDRITRLREALRLNIGDFSYGLTPSERVELIERRMEELRAERRAS